MEKCHCHWHVFIPPSPKCEVKALWGFWWLIRLWMPWATHLFIFCCAKKKRTQFVEPRDHQNSKFIKKYWQMDHEGSIPKISFTNLQLGWFLWGYREGINLVELETARKLFGGTAGGPGLFGRAKTPEESSTHIGTRKLPPCLGRARNSLATSWDISATHPSHPNRHNKLVKVVDWFSLFVLDCRLKKEFHSDSSWENIIALPYGWVGDLHDVSKTFPTSVILFFFKKRSAGTRRTCLSISFTTKAKRTRNSGQNGTKYQNKLCNMSPEKGQL